MSQYGPPPGYGQPGYGPLGVGPPTPPPAGSRPPGRRLIRIGVVVLVLSVVVGLLFTALAFVPLFRADEPIPVRDGTTIEGEVGDAFALYRLAGTDVPIECSVTDPRGREVSLTPVHGETLTINGTPYRTAFSFHTLFEGVHEVDCAPPGQFVAVGPRISLLISLVLGFVGIFGGIGLFLAGLITLIVGVVLRSSASRRQWGGPPYQGGPPYPGGPPFQGGPPYQG